MRARFVASLFVLTSCYATGAGDLEGVEPPEGWAPSVIRPDAEAGIGSVQEPGRDDEEPAAPRAPEASPWIPCDAILAHTAPELSQLASDVCHGSHGELIGIGHIRSPGYAAMQCLREIVDEPAFFSVLARADRASGRHLARAGQRPTLADLEVRLHDPESECWQQGCTCDLDEQTALARRDVALLEAWPDEQAAQEVLARWALTTEATGSLLDGLTRRADADWVTDDILVAVARDEDRGLTLRARAMAILYDRHGAFELAQFPEPALPSLTPGWTARAVALEALSSVHCTDCACSEPPPGTSAHDRWTEEQAEAERQRLLELEAAARRASAPAR